MYNKNNKKVSFPMEFYLDDFMIHKVAKSDVEEVGWYNSVTQEEYSPKYKY